MNATSHEPARAIRVPVVLCIAIAAAVVAALGQARASLPDPIATHWGADGRPNGFQALDRFLVFATVFTAGIGLAMVLVGALKKAAASTAPLAVGLSAFLGVLFCATTLTQRGLADAHQAPSSDSGMVPAVGAGILSAVVTWLLVRRWGGREAPAAAGLPESAPRLDVPVGQGLAWTGHTRRSPRALLVVAVACLLPGVSFVVLAVVNGQWGTATSLLLPVVIAVVAGFFLSATVSIGRRGVVARGLGLVTLVRIPLADIRCAEFVPDTGVMAWGGWGYRAGPDGQRALLTASGPAVRVERLDGRSVVITVDDAERAAAVVNTLVAQRDRVEGGAR